jgi:hypothetical protein
LQRLRGYSTVIAEAEGIRSIVCELPEGSRENAEARSMNSCRRGKRAWTAVFCMNDLIAVGVMQALEAQGIRVPEDVSVLGFDEPALRHYDEPRLTTLRVNRRELGREAVRLLLRRLAKPDAPLLQVEPALSPWPGEPWRPERHRLYAIFPRFAQMACSCVLGHVSSRMPLVSAAVPGAIQEGPFELETAL